MTAEHVKRIREFIKSKNLTIKGFCEITGIPESTIKNLLSTNGIPSIPTLKKIKDVYPEFNMEWALTGNSGNINTGTVGGHNVNISGSDYEKIIRENEIELTRQSDASKIYLQEIASLKAEIVRLVDTIKAKDETIEAQNRIITAKDEMICYLKEK